MVPLNASSQQLDAPHVEEVQAAKVAEKREVKMNTRAITFDFIVIDLLKVYRIDWC
jgi:ABC-type hemin transport system ATPase subunit